MTFFPKSKIAGMNIHYMQYPLEFFLDTMAKLDVRNIELWGGNPHFYIDDVTSSEVTKLKKELVLRELSLVCFTPEQSFTSPINIAAKEANIRKRSIEYFYKCANVAMELEAPLLLLGPGWSYENESVDEAWKRSRDSIEQIIQKTEIQIALEPVTQLESKIIYDLTTLKRMLDEIDSDKLKGMIDTIPMTLADENFEDYFNVLKEDLVHIHFVDGQQNEGLDHVAWGEGNLPICNYFKQLKNINYNGYLSLELISFDYFKDPATFVKKSIDHLSPYLY